MSEPSDPAMPEHFDYLERRVRAQRDWHSAKAAWNKRRYYLMEVATLLSGAAIPIVNVWGADSVYWTRVISAVLGAIVVVAAGIGKLFKFQENWLQYRTVVEALDREEEHYKIGASEYAGLDQGARDKLLVERIEGLLSSTTSQFITTHRSAAAAETPA